MEKKKMIQISKNTGILIHQRGLPNPANQTTRSIHSKSDPIESPNDIYIHTSLFSKINPATLKHKTLKKNFD